MDLWYTVGPSSLGKEEDLLSRGATGARLTFSYGTSAIQDERARHLREVAVRLGCPFQVVADLAGEKIRLGSFAGSPSLPVAAGRKLRLVCGTTIGTGSDPALPVPNPVFFSQLREGSVVTVGDGSAVLVVTRVSGDEASAEVLQDGVVDQNRGLTVQGRDFQPRSLTTKDLEDLERILASPFYDVVALSFVATAADVEHVRRRARQVGRGISVLAKIETAAGVDAIEVICAAADLVMAARGDLALALPWVDLPAAVERIAAAAVTTGTPWILATQIMEGLERFVLPTRAEICDLAHWLQRGCAGVLLSYETVFGRSPEAAVTSVKALLDRWGTPGSGRLNRQKPA